MKRVLLLCSLFSLFSLNSYADVSAYPMVAGGVRLGNGSSADKATAGYLSGKVNWLRFGNYHAFSILSPGIGIQTDGRFHGSVSPFVYSMNNGFSIGFDLIFPKNDEQNIFGLFIGYEFLP